MLKFIFIYDTSRKYFLYFWEWWNHSYEKSNNTNGLFVVCLFGLVFVSSTLPNVDLPPFILKWKKKIRAQVKKKKNKKLFSKSLIARKSHSRRTYLYSHHLLHTVCFFICICMMIFFFFYIFHFSSLRLCVFVFFFQHRRKSPRFFFLNWPRALGYRWLARYIRVTCRWTWPGWRTAARCTVPPRPSHRSTRTPPYWPWTTCPGPTRATIRAWPPTRCTAPRTRPTWTSTVPRSPHRPISRDHSSDQWPRDAVHPKIIFNIRFQHGQRYTY